jgi:hypothetical protein
MDTVLTICISAVLAVATIGLWVATSRLAKITKDYAESNREMVALNARLSSASEQSVAMMREARIAATQPLVVVSIKTYANTGNLQLRVTVVAQNDGPGSAVRPMAFQRTGPTQAWERVAVHQRPILRASEQMEIELTVPIVDIHADDQDLDTRFFRLVLRYEDVSANLYLLSASFQLAKDATILLHEQKILRIAKDNRAPSGSSLESELTLPGESIL